MYLAKPGIGLPLSGKREQWYIVVLSLFLIFFLGFRPYEHTMGLMGDTFNYAQAFNMISSYGISNTDKERIFPYLMRFLSTLGFSPRYFFLLIEFLYVGMTAGAIIKLTKGKASYLAFLATVSQFCFYSYGVNGIRQGMAQAAILLAIPYLIEHRYVIVGVLCLLAYNTHSSSLFLIIGLAATFFLKTLKIPIFIWSICLVLSVLASGMTSTIMEQAGVFGSAQDASYLGNDEADMTLFSQVGYRWDFLFYSIVPIVSGWYYIHKKNKDYTYLSIYNIYVLMNAAWLLVNQSWLSNRIAYLSWFIYGIVLIYPMLGCAQNGYRCSRILPWALLGNVAFTYMMWIVGKLN